MKKFVPFDQFERECSIPAKPLASSMQESCNDRFQPDEPTTCSDQPCPPYWQPTGVTKCLDNGLIDQEEEDGCGNTRWTRTVDVVVWTDTGETECDTPNNRIRKTQINQCGTTRVISTTTLCCTPVWVNTGEEPIYNCDQSMLRVQQEDGCGNTRFQSNGQAVVWTGTGEARCQPGDIYEIEQINQCGTIRWSVVGSGCPCIPDWTDVGSQRCTGEFVEQNQEDGCGATRWNNTGVLVVWTPNGEERCSATGYVQYQEVSQCGTTRWTTSTEDTCVNSPAPNEIPSEDLSWGYCNSGGDTMTITLMLNASTKLIEWSRTGEGVIGSAAWVTGTVNRADYEARITYISPEATDSLHVYSGSVIGQWYNLGDYTTVGGSFTCVDTGGTGADRVEWNFTEIRIDVRRVGMSIEGGASVGPLRAVGNGDCDP